MKKQIPNILTVGRLVLTVAMFTCFVLMATALRDPMGVWPMKALAIGAFATFAVAAITDFFDGYLARRWQVVSTFGAIMDPIADKVLVCGAILGLLALTIPGVLISGAIILFREFAVSAMREVLAPKGIKLPVTLLAKTKTSLQLLALGFYLALVAWATSMPDPALFAQLLNGAKVFLGVAAAVTVWTGIEYAIAARAALRDAR